jgi:hypothetical protein
MQTTTTRQAMSHQPTTNQSETNPVNIAGMPLVEHRHVCAFFGSPDEEYRVLLPFIQDGVDRGELLYQGVRRTRHEDHVRRLRHAGMDVDELERTGQLIIRSSEDMYMPGGSFDQERMLATIEAALQDGASRGFPLTRISAHPECVFADEHDTTEFLEYEARLNDLVPRYQDPVICLYDISSFDASILMDVLRTHPVVIVGGMLQENPFYMPPDQFLRELRSRRASEAAPIVH